MAGCFGNSREDRIRERELERHQDDLEREGIPIDAEGNIIKEDDEDDEG